MVAKSTTDQMDQQHRDEQEEIIRLLHRDLESMDRRVTRSRARAYNIPLREQAVDQGTARLESICRGKHPVHSAQKRANEAVPLLSSEPDDLGVPMIAEPEYDDKGNLIGDGDLPSSAEALEASDGEF